MIRKILRREKRKGKINLVLINDREIKKLNATYRNKNKPTDVLAFPMNEEGIIGDIAISTETARRNAAKYRVTYPAEMKRLVVHGVLHLLGYKHGGEMDHAAQAY
ncbi:MAG: rRNA maturation RNase YbeY [bacterium]